MNQNNTSHHFNIHFKFKGTGVETVKCYLSLSWINTQMDPMSPGMDELISVITSMTLHRET